MPLESSRENFGYIPPERQIEAGEAQPQTLTAWIVRTADAAKSYSGLTREEYEALFSQLSSFEDYLQRHFQAQLQGKNFKSSAEKDEYIKVLINEELPNYPKFFEQTQNLPRVPQEVLEVMIKSLQDKAKEAKNPEELCHSFGITYEKTADVLVPTFAKNPVKAGSGEGLKPTEYKDKLGELLPYLIENKLFGEHILVSEGQLRDNQMREYPYILVEIPELKKQILICNQLGEAIFVSQKWLGREIFAQADKQELQEGHGLEKVIYDSSGSWLERIKTLLLEEPNTDSLKTRDFGEAFESGDKLDLKDFARAKREILAQFPTSKELLNGPYKVGFFGDERGHAKFWKKAGKNFRGKSYYNAPINSDVLDFCQLVYGETDPNLTYALKAEIGDSEYFKKVIMEGLPEGVDYFLPDLPKKQNQERFKGCPTDMDFVKRYLAKGHIFETSQVLQEDLGLTTHKLMKIITPDAYERIRTPNRRVKEDGANVSVYLNPTAKDFTSVGLAIYPGSRQLQYMLDTEDPKKLTEMIKGGYKLDGIFGLNRRKKEGLFELKPEAFATFEDFWEKIVTEKGATHTSISEQMIKKWGFTLIHFISHMGINKETTHVKRSELVLAFKSVFPESRQLQYLLDRNNIDKVSLMIKGQYPLEGLKTHDSTGLHTLQPVVCPDFNTFQAYFLTGKIQASSASSFNQAFGITVLDLIQLAGGDKKKFNPTRREFCEALKTIYPENLSQIQARLDAGDKHRSE